MMDNSEPCTTCGGRGAIKVRASCGFNYGYRETQMPCPKCTDFMGLGTEKLLVTKEEVMQQRTGPRRHTNTNFEKTLEAVKERRQGKRNAARQWSLLVWLLEDDTRPLGEDASPLLERIITLVRSETEGYSFHSTPKMISLIKEEAVAEAKES